MATNIIYKGELDGTQVNFETGSLTDISTFDTDVRSSAIQDSITNGVTDRGASQDAIHTMSGVLASLSNHPDITPASDIAIDNSSGTVLQDASFTFDSDGHVTAASFNSTNLDDRYFTEAEVTGISGSLQSQITSNDGDIAANAASIATNTGNISANATSIAANAASIATNTGNIAVLQAATGSLKTNITDNDAELITLRTATGFLEGQINDLEANSGVPNLDAVTAAGPSTTNDITVGDIRVGGGNITGPATITIDPDSAGASGKVVIAGDLQVDGTTTTINSTSVQIDDLSLVLGTGAPNAASADGGGIIIDGTGTPNIAEFTFDGTNNRWKTNSIDIAADIVGTATSAEAWSNARDITLGGDLSGSASIDGSSDATLTATIGAGVVENDMLENASVAITGGAGLDGGGNAVLGGSAVSLSISAGEGLTANTDSLDINLDGTTLTKSSSGLKVNSIGTSQIANDAVTSAKLDSSVAGDNITFTNGVLSVADSDILAGVQSNLDDKADKTTDMSAGNGLTGGGTLSANRTFATTSDQGHLNEIKLGEDSTNLTDIIVKGGILILRGLSTNGITTSGSDGDVLALDQKTTVSYDGIVQIMNKDEDADDGSWNGLWKVQGIIRRDSGSTISKVSCFTTKIHAGSNLSAYNISTTTSSTGFVISAYNAGNTIPNNIVTTATLNYNWSQEA